MCRWYGTVRSVSYFTVYLRLPPYDVNCRKYIKPRSNFSWEEQWIILVHCIQSVIYLETSLCLVPTGTGGALPDFRGIWVVPASNTPPYPRRGLESSDWLGRLCTQAILPHSSVWNRWSHWCWPRLQPSHSYHPTCPQPGKAPETFVCLKNDTPIIIFIKILCFLKNAVILTVKLRKWKPTLWLLSLENKVFILFFYRNIS